MKPGFGFDSGPNLQPCTRIKTTYADHMQIDKRWTWWKMVENDGTWWNIMVQVAYSFSHNHGKWLKQKWLYLKGRHTIGGSHFSLPWFWEEGEVIKHANISISRKKTHLSHPKLVMIPLNFQQNCEEMQCNAWWSRQSYHSTPHVDIQRPTNLEITSLGLIDVWMIFIQLKVSHPNI